MIPLPMRLGTIAALAAWFAIPVWAPPGDFTLSLDVFGVAAWAFSYLAAIYVYRKIK